MAHALQTSPGTTRPEEDNMNIQHTKKQLEIQGFNLNDEELREIGPYMRWATVFCASTMALGTALGSPWILWGLATTAIAGVFLPSHPFDYAYNYGVRHLTGTRPLPPNTPQRHFACGLAGTWLIVTGVAFYFGADTAGYILGASIAAPAALVAVTHVCIPSYVYNALFAKKTATAAE